MRQEFRHRLGLARSLFLAVICVLGWSVAAAAQSIQTYPIPTAASFAIGITGGPDGALWFTEANPGKIGRVTIAGMITNEFVISTANSQPVGIAAGSDGALWFTEYGSNKIGRITTAGVITDFAIATANSGPHGITAGPDGALWFTEYTNAGKIGRITTAGAITEFAIPTAASFPYWIAAGPDGALWFTEEGGNKIGRITTAGTFTEFPIPTANSNVYGIAAGSDGALWFAESANPGKIGRITTAGTFTEFAIPTANSQPEGITAGPDGALWFTENDTGKIGRITTAGTITEFAAAATSFPRGIAAGSNNALWFTLYGANQIGTFTTGMLTVAEAGAGAGRVTSNVPVSGGQINCSATSTPCTLIYMASLPVTLTASAASGSTFSGWSGGGCSGTAPCTLTPTLGGNTTVTATFAQTITSFMLSITPASAGSGTVTSSPSGITCGTTCSASFSSGARITLTASAASGSTFAGWSGGGCNGILACAVTISANTAVTATFVPDVTTNIALFAAVLPLSRSIEVGGTPATAFATIINAGPSTASTCSIAPATMIPASFAFQTTNPTTNAVSGTPNTPANIASGGLQTFVIAFTPNAAFTPTNINFTFGCANANPAPATIGVNTLNLSASTSPVPDIVALAASGDPGYVDIPGATGTGDFAVATVNLGAAAQITASANTGTANLPVTLLICQTNSTGACLANPAANVTTMIAANATPTFAIFATGSAAASDSPGVNRVFVSFTDAGGVLRGETSVAARTH